MAHHESRIFPHSPSAVVGFPGLEVFNPDPESEKELSPWSSPSVSPSTDLRDQSEKEFREDMYARVIYRTWRSWKYPGAPDATTAVWNGDKCPMTSCSRQFGDIDSVLVHLDRDCQELRNWVDAECARIQSPAIWETSESQRPRARSCPWCRTRSVFGNAKPFSLKGKIQSLRESIKKCRKNNGTPEPIVQGVDLSSRPSSSGESIAPSNFDFLFEPGDIFPHTRSVSPLLQLHREGYHTSNASIDYQSQILEHPVNPPPQPPPPTELAAMDGVVFELGNTSECQSAKADAPGPLPVLETPRLTLGFEVSVRHASPHPPTKSSTAVSDMSEITALTRGRDSLLSCYSQETRPTPPSTLCLSPIDITIQRDSTKPTLTESFSLSPVEANDDDFADFPPTNEPIRFRSGSPRMSNSDLTFARPASRVGPATPRPRAVSEASEEQQNHLPGAVEIAGAGAGARTRASPLQPATSALMAQTALRLAGQAEDTSQSGGVGAPSVGVWPNDDHVYRFQLKLENLKVTFSKTRQVLSDATSTSGGGGEPVDPESLSDMPDQVVLLRSLDSFKSRLLQNRNIDELESTIFNFCFVYLVLAMMAEIKHKLPPDFRKSVCGEATGFVDSEGETNLGPAFLYIAIHFLDHLSSDLNSGLNHVETPPERNRRRLATFQMMDSYLRAHPLPFRHSAPAPPPTRPSSSRQDSYNSTASTLVDADADADADADIDFEPQEPLLQQETPIKAGYQNLCHQTHHSPVAPAHAHAYAPATTVQVLPQSAPMTHPPTTPRRRGKGRRNNTGIPLDSFCAPCQFFPSLPDQQKKLARHLITRRHILVMQDRDRENLGVLEANSLGPSEVPEDLVLLAAARFPCPLRGVDGSPCPKTFTRKDNLKAHCDKRKHFQVEEEEEEGEDDERGEASHIPPGGGRPLKKRMAGNGEFYLSLWSGVAAGGLVFDGT